MKAKITIAVTVLLLGTITTANADLYIQSPTGLTQAQWNATDTYKNFTCPSDYARSEGVDMNFTTTRADDYWFASCSPREVFLPSPIYTTQPTSPTITPPANTETSTVTVTPNTTSPTNNTATVVTDTRTATTETTTATTVTSNTIDSLYAQIMALFTQLLALIANLNR
jgi:hypothetical protein